MKGQELKVKTSVLAAMAGVNCEAVVRYARRHGIKSNAKPGRHNYLSEDEAERYLNLRGLLRSAEKPHGYKALKVLVQESGATYTYWLPRIRKPDVRAVNVKNSIHIDPDDFAFLLSEYHGYRPLPGWVLVSEVRLEVGCTKEAINQWIRRNKVERRKFLGSIKRPDYYIREADALRYKEGFPERQARHNWRKK
jgi:hypothetical protein